jgi:choline dehydrogenase
MISTQRHTVIVGGGTAGAVVASRLCESAHERVTLVEAGPDFPDPHSLPPSLRDPYSPALESFDWGRSATTTEPDGRVVPYPLGRVMGGSSTINGTNAQRGLPRDYDDWERLGNAGWSWADVLPYFVRLESDADFQGDFHGRHGPVTITRPGIDEAPRALGSILGAAVEKGFAYGPDQNAPEPGAIGPVPRNIAGGARAGSLLAYLASVRGRPNLEIRCETRAHRVLLEGNRAAGVELEDRRGVSQLGADRVVVAAGTIHTPLLLWASGIGPGRRLRELGITVNQDIPGVGRHLVDHPNIHLMAPLRDRPTAGGYAHRLVLRATSSVGPAQDVLVIAGIASDAGSGGSGRWHLKLSPLVAKPDSSGWLDFAGDRMGRLTPVIHLGLLNAEADLRRMREATRLACDLLAAPQVGAHVALGDGPSAPVLASDPALDRWLLEHVRTAFHPVGTCQMGPPGNDEAVVDSRLAVHGTRDLFVADASVMPAIPTGMVHLTCLMIGERCSDWLRDT